jgi:hypothetical protein
VDVFLPFARGWDCGRGALGRACVGGVSHHRVSSYYSLMHLIIQSLIQ